jgi:hypothetical protein
MNNDKRAKLIIGFFCIGIFLFLFVGCELYGKVGGANVNLPGLLPEMLRGEWSYTQPGATEVAERYIIQKTTVTDNNNEDIEEDFIQYGMDTKTNTNYKGIVRFVSNYSETSGVIIIEYTEKPSYAFYNGNSFFGIYYRIIDNDTIQIANSINPDGLSAPDTATLNEAKEKFTRFNMGTYVNWGTVQPQKRVR